MPVRKPGFAAASTIVVCALAVMLFWILHAMNFFEILYETTRKYEHLQLDEWLNAFFVAVPALIILLVVRTQRLSSEVRLRRRAESEASTLANYDVLTGLANRRMFRAEFTLRLAEAERTGTELSVFIIDLDRFKVINDLYGHGTGDELLRTVAARIHHVTRAKDLAARIGGDEFAIISDAPYSDQSHIALLERLVKSIDQPVATGQYQLGTTTSIGVASFPKDGNSVELLIQRADQALYEAKAAGKNRFALFDETLAHTMNELRLLEEDLRIALGTDCGQIFPHYQPILNLSSHRITQFEVLARWQHPTRGLLDALDFASIAEDIGMTDQLYTTILSQACAAARDWDSAIGITVNLSPAQFSDKDLVNKTLRILADHGFPAARLELEITERTLVQDFVEARRIIQQLRRVGIRVSLDDFGTGYSGLRHLHALTVDKIKIDRSFVEATSSQADTKIIVSAMIALGHTLGLTVTAEGIEDDTEEAWLIAQGCDSGQGFLFSRALPAEAAAQLARTGLLPDVSARGSSGSGA